MTQGASSSVYLWSDLDSQRLNMAGKGVHQRTLLFISWLPGDVSGTTQWQYAWSVNVHQTDASNAVAPTAVIRPVFNWESLAEKSPLDMGHRLFTSNVGGSGGYPFATNLTMERDIKVKRKMDDTDALMLTMEFLPLTGTGVTQRVYIASRTYVTW